MIYCLVPLSPPPDWHQRQIGEDPDIQLRPGSYNRPSDWNHGPRRQELSAGRGSAGWDELLAAGVLQPGNAHGTAGRIRPGGFMSLSEEDGLCGNLLASCLLLEYFSRALTLEYRSLLFCFRLCSVNCMEKDHDGDQVLMLLPSRVRNVLILLLTISPQMEIQEAIFVNQLHIQDWKLMWAQTYKWPIK